jgi:hypothetical protein
MIHMPFGTDGLKAHLPSLPCGYEVFMDLPLF